MKNKFLIVIDYQGYIQEAEVLTFQVNYKFFFNIRSILLIFSSDGWN